jgi:hypothetical protein
LFEGSGKKYLDDLDNIADERFGMRVIVPYDEEKAYICHTCCGSLDKWKSLVRKAEEEKKIIISKLEALIDRSTVPTILL